MSGSASRQIRRVSDEALLQAAAEARHMRELLQLLGLAAYGGNYESIRYRLTRLGAMDPRFAPRSRKTARTLAAVTSEQLAEALAEAQSLRQVLVKLDLPQSTPAYAGLRARLAEEGLPVALLRSRGWSAGLLLRPRVPLEDLLVAGRGTTTAHLKRRLLREGVLEACCAVCGIRDWQGQPAPLELDHINGDRRDNRLENLRLLCPNCHAQTPTYRGRNIGRTDLAQ